MVKTNQIWREANGCADLLAKKGADQTEHEIFYDTCPVFLTQLFLGTHWDSPRSGLYIPMKLKSGYRKSVCDVVSCCCVLSCYCVTIVVVLPYGLMRL